MDNLRRNSSWLCTFVLVLSASIFAHIAVAQSYPSKQVRFIVSAGAGGSDDFHARIMAQKFTQVFGQKFVVENRPGAGGLIGQTAVVNAPPDGYTILDRKSTRLNSSHSRASRMPSSA